MGPKKFHENFDKTVFFSSFAPFFFCFIVQLVILQILFKGSELTARERARAVTVTRQEPRAVGKVRIESIELHEAMSSRGRN